MDIEQKLKAQRIFFQKGSTLDITYRKQALKSLRKVIRENESEILEALEHDLGKSPFESFASEIGLVYSEITYMLKNIDRLSRPERAATEPANFPSVSRIYKEPYGSVLIMAPWNYPFQLSLIPLIGAVAAGNCAVVKPSDYAPCVAHMVDVIIDAAFDKRHVFTVTGGREANQSLLSHSFDYIFFTGGKTVGRLVMHAAAEHLTPVTLELGGKSPCIVDETADISLAAKRIAWGKFINCGQTCVAPDYIYVHKNVKKDFLKALIRSIEAFYGCDPINNKDYGKIVNEKHFDRLTGLFKDVPLYYGGRTDRSLCRIAPVIIDHADWNMKVMQEEIFGPVIPILEYDDLGEVKREIRKHPKPLALYLFTSSKIVEKDILNSVSFGGGCINDTLMHLCSSSMPFGGVGESGMGNYHGRYSFDTFTHKKSILKKDTHIDLPIRYAPFRKNLNLLKLILR